MLPTVTSSMRADHGEPINSIESEIEASICFIVQCEDIPVTTTNGSSPQVFNIELPYLINPQTRELYIQDMLSQIEIPPSSILGLAQQISNYAAAEALLCQERGSQSLHITVDLNVVLYRTIEEETEDIEATLMDIAREEGFRLTPASRSSIEALEIKKFDDTQEPETCMVCMDEYVTGVDIVPLPCSHFFHSECIVKWLEYKNLCPLCRFAMPTED
ncbi:E3 ubiquitin-protein ligase SDIR1-like [Macadamia integrifolia]|uniref:E3 ubiquitin-protein ligase SDIR1-like n=1 Tax=Macadamia integrifolia TaxID=60698 RepID=UPI001C4E68C8|nr:E3 ubiquitin-protein ligase SDIR1-like [Macadamia integrifolia]